MTNRPDPAAAFTAPLGDPNRLAAVPLRRGQSVPGILPDPRNPNGPTHYAPAPRLTFRERIGLAVLEILAGERINTFPPALNDHAAVPASAEPDVWPDCGRGPSRRVLTTTVWVLAGLAVLVAALVGVRS